MRNIAWFSAGCSSFIASYLMRQSLDHCVYIDIWNQHPDSLRFVREAERLLDHEIEIIRSDTYSSVDEVIRVDRYINGVMGAPCTKHLKREVREKWEKDHDISADDAYIWGYDSSEQNRAKRLSRKLTYVDHLFPLIEEGLTKEDVHGMCEKLGIKRPVMYDLGYPNNNCVGCVKGGMGYWNKIRRDFPDVFKRRAKQEREIGHSCIKNIFLDELEPDRGNVDIEVMPDCSIMCELAMKETE